MFLPPSGTLLNAVLAELVEMVVWLEDISMEGVTLLMDAFQGMVKEAPLLFREVGPFSCSVFFFLKKKT